MIKDKSLAQSVGATQVVSSMDTADGFALLQRQAKMLCDSDFVPKQFKKISNAIIALNLAQRLGTDPLMIMQNLYVVHGSPAFSAKFLIARVAATGKFTALRYEFIGERGEMGWGCLAQTRELSTGDNLIGTAVTMQMAKDEGWTTKNGSKWKNIPEQMLRYRAATFWVNAYCPDASMGFPSVDEMHDVYGPQSERDMGKAEIVDVAEELNRRLDTKVSDTIVKDDPGESAQVSKGADDSGEELVVDANGEVFMPGAHEGTIKAPVKDNRGAFILRSGTDPDLLQVPF